MGFDYKSKQDLIAYTSQLSKNLYFYSPEDVLTGGHLYQEFDEQLIKKLIDGLQLDNLNLYLFSPSLESNCDLTCKWNGTKYSKSKFSDDLVKKYSSLNGADTFGLGMRISFF